MIPPTVKARVYDLGAASPLIVWYAMAVAGLAPRIGSELAQAMSLRLFLQVTAEIVTVVFLGVQMLLFFIRRLPVAKEAGWLPRLCAIVGANLPLALLALPRAQHGLVLTAVGYILVIAGTAGAVVVALWLGRGFSILPQARRLVTDGPYRRIRHPLYLAEQLVTFGAMWQFQQPWSALIALASFAAQFPRMHFEEHILARTFPEYGAYCARTWRLIPGLY
jgi:protein-S-isoprenylcysteine O-methyltransferase Ste14